MLFLLLSRFSAFLDGVARFVRFASSGIRFVSVLFGGTTLLVWSVFGNCAGTDLVGVRLGLLMRCVRACVDDIQHQCVIKGMQQTECFRAKFRPRPCGDEPIMKW